MEDERITEAFILTPDHIKLLRSSFTSWDDYAYGAAEINPKRPYGNSDVEHDIAELFGYIDSDQRGSKATDDLDGFLGSEKMKYIRETHRQTETALHIVLSTGTFEPGEYECILHSEWRKKA